MSGWKSGGTGREPLRHGYGLRSLLPGQTGSSLPEKGLNTAAYFHERRSLNNFHRDRVITFEQIAE
ncbi:TPA: hypothetical protein ACH7XJ_004941 [Escherichia coli]